jgi:hypothetical protein
MIETKNRGGRPAFEPTDSQRQLVQVLVSNGIAQRVIAHHLSIHEDTLRKHFRDELESGREHVEAALGAALVRAGLAGNVNAIRYWLCTHGGPEWKVTERREIGGIDGAPMRIALADMTDDDIRRELRDLHERERAAAETRALVPAVPRGSNGMDH